MATLDKNLLKNAILALPLFRRYEIHNKTKLVAFPEISVEMQKIGSQILEKELTMTSVRNLSFTAVIAEQIMKANLPGDFVEVGVWRGGHLIMAAAALHGKKKVLGFDTFSGMTEPDESEVNLFSGKKAVTRYQELKKGGWKPASRYEVQESIKSFGIPSEHFSLIEGDVISTFASYPLPEKISVLRIDLDWYQGTRHTLEVLYPIVTSGGVVIIDDYGSWSGARDAVVEYLNAINYHPVLFPIDGGAVFFVKS